MSIQQNPKIRRAHRVRAKLNGTADRPRISVHRSNVHMYVQAIDDVARTTIASANSKSIKDAGSKADLAKKVGIALGEQLKGKKITKGIFDRGSYRYHGRVAQVADGVREAGIEM